MGENTFTDVGKGLLTVLPKDCGAQVKHHDEGVMVQGTVLIADGVATNRILLKAKLKPWSYDVIVTGSAEGLLAQARREAPTLIILSDNLPDGRAAMICAQFKADKMLLHVPIIAIARSQDEADRLCLLRAGADDVFARPLRDMVLQARMRSLIRARIGIQELNLRDGTSRAMGFAEAQQNFAPPGRVALLAPDLSTAETWQSSLAPTLGNVRLSSHGFRDSLAVLSREPVPDVFVIGLHGPSASRGLRLLADLRASPATRHAGVLAILEDSTNPTLAADALDLGAGDLMAHGFAPAELALRLGSQITQKQTQDRLRAWVEDDLRAAVRDPMTGLFNRRYAMPYLTRVIEENIQSGRGFAVMVADLDHFKTVNDRFGHAAGDAVLIEAARRLRSDLRAEDLIARMGGEEFLIVLPESSREDAHIAAERLRTSVNAAPFVLPGLDQQIRITVSIGVAVCCFECLARTPAVQNATRLLKLADDALYGSKGAGRNLVTMVHAA